MNFTRTCAALASISTALILAEFNSFQAGEIRIVSPSAYRDREGEGQASNCCPPSRFQQVFPAEDFAALGNKPHWIVAYTWRPDQSVTRPLTVQLPDQQVRLSTTQRAPKNLSLELDANFGSDVRQFYRGRVLPVADAHSGPGPRSFYRTEFPAGVTPFLYDPSQGNLLFDVISWQGETPARADLIPGMQTALFAEPPLATRGDRNEAAIFQFTFVPPPALSNPAFSGRQFQFTLTGEANMSYIIQAATNLQSWTPLATNDSPTVSRTVTMNAPMSPSFYRAVPGPY